MVISISNIPFPVIAKCEKVNRTFGPAVQKFCRTGQDLTGPKIFFFLNLKNYIPTAYSGTIHG